MSIITCSAPSTSRHLAQLSLSCGGLKGKHERMEVGHGQEVAVERVCQPGAAIGVAVCGGLVV